MINTGKEGSRERRIEGRWGGEGEEREEKGRRKKGKKGGKKGKEGEEKGRERRREEQKRRRKEGRAYNPRLHTSTCMLTQSHTHLEAA